MEPSQGSARVPCLLPFLQFYSLFIFISLPLGLRDFFGSVLQQKNFLQFAVWHALRLMTDLPNEIVLGQAKDLCKRAQGIRENLQQSTAARSLGPKAHWAEPEQAQAEWFGQPESQMQIEMYRKRDKDGTSSVESGQCGSVRCGVCLGRLQKPFHTHQCAALCEWSECKEGALWKAANGRRSRIGNWSERENLRVRRLRVTPTVQLWWKGANNNR